VGQPFLHSFRVRYAECDLQGVVFNAHYLAYFDLGITELWREAVGGYQAMLKRDVDLVVAEAQLRFRQPAHFDDELTLEISIAHMGDTSILSEHRVRRDEVAIVEGTLRHVVIDRRAMTKGAIPAWLREGLEPWGREVES
jgi:acyl-CoA thioester hydrolase